MSKKKILLAGVVLALSFSSCKKNNSSSAVRLPDIIASLRESLTKDSIFLYAKEVYFWNDDIPAYAAFAPRNYVTYYQILYNIAKVSNNYDYINGKNDLKYSFFSNKDKQNQAAFIQEEPQSSVDLNGNGNDIGIWWGLHGGKQDYKIYVAAIYKNSPAEKQGFVRGDRITKINGVSYGANYDGEITNIKAAIEGKTITLDGIKADGTVFSDIVLNKRFFRTSPVYNASILKSGTKKIGYLAYARFSSESNSKQELDNAFEKFATEGVTDLIIDLRYNGGGYISTAEHLINLIAPSSTEGKVMFKEHYNQTMQSGKAKILANQPIIDQNDEIKYYNGRMMTYANIDYSVAANTSRFKKEGNLTNVTNVVFIGTKKTASAAELVINSLKPYMNVKLVGEKTYGKPIGFFPITIENKYQFYFAMFEVKNAENNGDYYAGLIPDKIVPEIPTGDVMYDFGDSRDNYIKTALNILNPTPVSNDKTTVAKIKEAISLKAVSSSSKIDESLNDENFNGMIEDRIFKR